MIKFTIYKVCERMMPNVLKMYSDFEKSCSVLGGLQKNYIKNQFIVFNLNQNNNIFSFNCNLQ